jgi:hypothetical protein
LPFGHRRSLLGHPMPAGELGSPYGRLTGRHRPDPDGVTTLRTLKLRPGWVPPVPRGRWCSPGRPISPASACRSSAASPCTPFQHPINGVRLTRHQRRFKPFTRPVCPSPVAPDGAGALGLSPEIRTPPTKSRRRTSGWGQAMSTGPELHARHQSILLSVCSLVSVHPRCRNMATGRVSRPMTRSRHAGSGAGSTTG